MGLTDYLLKPVLEEELKDAVARVHRRIHDGSSISYLNKMTSSMLALKITFPIVNGIIRIPVNEIFYAEAKGKFTHLVAEHSRREMIAIGISEVEKLCDGAGLRRVDRFLIINPEKIEKVSQQLHKIYFRGNLGLLELSVSKKGIDEIAGIMKGY